MSGGRSPRARPVPEADRPTLKGLLADEGGASMVFAAMTLYALTLSIMFVYQVGLVSADRIQIQTAADAAAYSAVQVEANALNSIAQLNDGLAYLTYTLMRHAVDATVYGTLNEFQQHGDPKPPGQILMGDDEGKSRIDEVKKRIRDSQGPFQRGREWLADIHLAMRLILATTPRHMREAAIAIAKENGASHIGMAGDFDQAFVITNKATGGGGGGGLKPGFWEPSERGKGFYDPLYTLYADEETPELARAGGKAENKQRELPDGWWDASIGAPGNSPQYGQLRICWVKEDWGHRPGQSHSQAASPFNHFTKEPNAHWHTNHVHGREQFVGVDPNTGQEIWVPAPLQHGGPPASGGAEVEGGHAQDPHPLEAQQRWTGQDPTTLTHEQHWLRLCPVCGRMSATIAAQKPDATSSGVWKRVGDAAYSGSAFASPQVGQGSPMEVVKLNGGFFPRPLIGLDALLRSGVTVVTYRKSRGIGDTFAASPWGMVAVASAQVGLRKGKNVLTLTSFESRSAKYEGAGGDSASIALPNPGGSDRAINLLYANDSGSDRVRFAGRLVPIASPYTWQQAHANGKGLQGLFGGGGQVAWYRCSDGESEMPAEAAQVRGFVSARNADALRAFWH